MSGVTSSKELWLKISIADQSLCLLRGKKLLEVFDVSTGSNGAGEQFGSECTPRGWHKVRAKIGAEQPENTVFIGRRPTGEIYSAELNAEQPGRDWVLSRILWLSGLEPGLNRMGNVDTMRRYIYIHGTPDDVELGVPNSHGCVRMHNCDIIDLFNEVPVGTRVYIQG